MRKKEREIRVALPVYLRRCKPGVRFRQQRHLRSSTGAAPAPDRGGWAQQGTSARTPQRRPSPGSPGWTGSCRRGAPARAPPPARIRRKERGIPPPPRTAVRRRRAAVGMTRTRSAQGERSSERARRRYPRKAKGWRKSEAGRGRTGRSGGEPARRRAGSPVDGLGAAW